jgi:GTP pyrophosphokinase
MENVLQTELPQPSERSSNAVDVEGTDDVLVKLARCCTPVPGDSIMGFHYKGQREYQFTVQIAPMHQIFTKHQADRVVNVKWRTGAALDLPGEHSS